MTSAQHCPHGGHGLTPEALRLRVERQQPGGRHHAALSGLGGNALRHICLWTPARADLDTSQICPGRPHAGVAVGGGTVRSGAASAAPVLRTALPHSFFDLRWDFANMFVDCGGKARAECFPLFLRNPTGGLYRLLTTGTSRFLEVPRKVLLPVQVPGKSEVCPCFSILILGPGHQVIVATRPVLLYARVGCCGDSC